MMKVLIFTSLCFICTACGFYQTSFDCPPGKGIGCAPVNDVLDMIVERESGEDLFVTDLGAALLLKEEEKNTIPISRCTLPKKLKLHLIKQRSGELIFREEIE